MSSTGNNSKDNTAEKRSEDGHDIDQNQVVVTIPEAHQENVVPNTSKINSYEIEDKMKNTERNPYRETNVTVPHLIRKVPENKLTPPPFTSFTQIICFSWISVPFCCLLGAYASKNAMKAKIQQGKGLYGLAQSRAKRAVYLSYVSFAIGITTAIALTLAFTL